MLFTGRRIAALAMSCSRRHPHRSGGGNDKLHGLACGGIDTVTSVPFVHARTLTIADATFTLLQ